MTAVAIAISAVLSLGGISFDQQVDMNYWINVNPTFKLKFVPDAPPALVDDEVAESEGLMKMDKYVDLKKPDGFRRFSFIHCERAECY